MTLRAETTEHAHTHNIAGTSTNIAGSVRHGLGPTNIMQINLRHHRTTTCIARSRPPLERSLINKKALRRAYIASVEVETIYWLAL